MRLRLPSNKRGQTSLAHQAGVTENVYAAVWLVSIRRRHGSHTAQSFDRGRYPDGGAQMQYALSKVLLNAMQAP